VGRSVKTQLSKERNLLVRRRRHVSAVLGHLQVNKLFTISSSEEKIYTYAYLGVLCICGVQRDLVFYWIKLFMNWLKLCKYVKFSVGLETSLKN
jgi:hypothetical protein